MKPKRRRIDAAEEENNSQPVDQEVVDEIWPFIEGQGQGITLPLLLEKFPDLSRSQVNGALIKLIADEKIEKFGERRGRTYSLFGLGEIEKQSGIVAPEEVKEWLLAELTKCRASRPLILAQKTPVQRNILDAAFADLERSGATKHFGEGRAKIWAIKGVKEDEADIVRDEQKATSTIFDPLSAMLVDGRFFSLRNHEGAIRLVRKDSSFAVVGTQSFEDYAETKTWLLSQIGVTK